MLEQCDCTADCGDCPGIKLGTHAACDFKQRDDEFRDRRYKADSLVKELGYPDTLSALSVLKELLSRANTNAEKI